MAPIAIISVANKSEIFDNVEIEKIVNETRDEYNSKFGEIVNNHSLTKIDKNIKFQELRNDYDIILKNRFSELKLD